MKVNIDLLPLTITFAKISNNIIVDPTLEEENVLDSKITLGISQGKVVSIQKTVGVFNRDDIKYILEKAVEIYPKIRDIVIRQISQNKPSV